MELLSILLARAVAWIEPAELNPRGTLFYLDVTKALVSRYGFQKFPQKIEEFNETQGITFAAGRLGESVIEQLIIYTHGIVLDTRTSTEHSKRLLEEALQWGAKDLGLTYKPSMIRRWNYASSVVLRSQVPLTTMHPAFQNLAEAMTKNTAAMTGESLTYQLTNFTIDFDQLARKHPLGRFSIQRRENTPFSENKYFSDAPLPTELHIKLLEQFEADISRK